MSPEDLGKAALLMAKKNGLEAKLLDERELSRENMHALLAVGAGSVRPPRLIVVQYDPGSGEKPIALVGKGIVFDTGGYCIKPIESLTEMKYDKCGACVVLGVMQAIARLRFPIPVVALIPAAENMISGSAYRTGDIVDSRSGKTIEVLNTDAEGRLVLADAIDYAITKFEPQAVIDVATLTGAAYYALGDHSCAVFGSDDGLIARLRDAGERAGERAWPLPLTEDYRTDVTTPHADVRNTSAWGGGAIAGATFLQRFVRGVPWAHLDVASVSRDRRNPSRGATGFGTRLLIETLERWPRARGRRSARARARPSGGSPAARRRRATRAKR
jgi:leucyl aminopeptidase